MKIEFDHWSLTAAILAMAVATYPMRAGGFWLMGRLPLTPRVQRMLNALPGAIVIATVLPILMREGFAGWIAVAAALAVNLMTRNDIAALVVGVVAGATARALGL